MLLRHQPKHAPPNPATHYWSFIDADGLNDKFNTSQAGEYSIAISLRGYVLKSSAAIIHVSGTNQSCP
jgi:hypothetical protein